MYILKRENLRDPAKLGALEDGQLQILPAAFWSTFSLTERAIFCHDHAIYCIPTLELVQWLRDHIAGRRAIEIGSGNGVLAAALGIPGTDSFQQADGMAADYFRAMGQPAVRYGANVHRLDGEAALRRYEPEVVIGAWVTHRYNPLEDWREGNMFGVEEHRLIERAEYVNIGHTKVHAGKPIWALRHTVHYPNWLVSRAVSEGRNYIAVWRRQ